MTSAEFEAYVREIPRIRALKAMQDAEVAMIPHISNFARREWFRSMTKVLMPKFEGNNVISFNGRKVNFSGLKRQFNMIAKKVKADKVAG